MGATTKATLQSDIDSEIKTTNRTYFARRLPKTSKSIENQFVNSNSSIQGIASSLATYNVLMGNTNLINKEIDIYRSITREDLKKQLKNILTLTKE